MKSLFVNYSESQRWQSVCETPYDCPIYRNTLSIKLVQKLVFNIPSKLRK